jgi:hypothetical protein
MGSQQHMGRSVVASTGTGEQDGFDEDEAFFQGYDSEQAAPTLSPFEMDITDQAPSPEQLAHAARFRKPVAAVVAALSLLSVVALGMRGSRQSSQRQLVARYNAALPAPTAAPPALQPSAEAAPEPILLEPMILEPGAPELGAPEAMAATAPSTSELAPGSNEPIAFWPRPMCRLDASAVRSAPKAGFPQR